MAQDYSPFSLDHEWIFDMYENGSIVGTDTMRCEEVIISGDTMFYQVYDYKHYTDGRPQVDPELDIFYDGVADLNNVYTRASLSADLYIDLLYFKHVYTHLESYTNLFFTCTPYYFGDYELPSGKEFGDCFWLHYSLSDSTGFMVAPDLGIIAAFEDGLMVRALQGSNLPPVTHEVLGLCEGDSVMLHGRYVSEEGVYRDTLSAGNGDSIVSTTVTVWPLTESMVDAAICEGDSYFAGGAEQTAGGVYYDTLQSADGCDSIIVTNLEILPVTGSTVNMTICEGESYFAGGAEQTEAGTYYDTFQNAAGCDSVVTTNLTVEICPTAVPGKAGGAPLRVYPNPTSGLLYIESGRLERIEIFNILGKLVHESGNRSFDFSGLPEGYYYLKCYETDQSVTVRKVIYQR
jgi:hypothetical protein